MKLILIDNKILNFYLFTLNFQIGIDFNKDISISSSLLFKQIKDDNHLIIRMTKKILIIKENLIIRILIFLTIDKKMKKMHSRITNNTISNKEIGNKDRITHRKIQILNQKKSILPNK